MDTPTFTPADVVMFAGQKDAVNLKAAFDQMVGQKVVDAISARKIEVASSMFEPPVEAEAELEAQEQQDGEEQVLDAAAEEEQAGEEQIAQETEEPNEDTEVAS